MTKGWCPLHDRIVDSGNGKCPDCGTPLVDLTARPRVAGEARVVVEEETSEPEAAPISVAPPAEAKLWPEIRLPERFFRRDAISLGPAAVAAILAVAVVSSFLVGLAIPRGRDDEASPPVRSDLMVGVARRGPGIDVRLERFVQDGARVTIRATFEKVEGADVGSIQSIDLSPIVEPEDPTPSMNIEVRNTVSASGTPGFIAVANLPMAESVAIKGLRIETLYLSAKEGTAFPLDLSALAPSSSGTPRVRSVRSPRRVAGLRGFTVSDVVGWPDRLEVRMDVTGGRESWVPDEAFSLEQSNGSVDGYRDDSIDDPSSIHLVFPVPPPWSERSVLRVTMFRLQIVGPWVWEFP